jgi:hypothetical protein
VSDPWEVRIDIIQDSTSYANGAEWYRARFDNHWSRCDPWTDECHRHTTPEDAVDCLEASVERPLRRSA